MSRKTVYNAGLVTEEKWALVNSENKELMREFLNYLSSVGRSKETISQYENDLRIFFVWYLEKGKNKHFTEIKKREVANFQGYLLNDCGMSSSRIRRLRSTLSSLSNSIELLYDDEYPNFRNIINKIEAPANTPVREKTVVTFDDCEQVAQKLVEKGNYQLACLLAFACYSGLRKQELIRLQVKDFTSEVNMELGGSFYKTSPIKVKGRGNRVESKYVWNKVDKYLELWLEERAKLGVTSDYLFCRKADGGTWSSLLVSTMNSYSKTLEHLFGVATYWHQFRHTYPTMLTKAGIPLEVCKILLGHNTLEMSQKYVDIDETESLSAFEDFFTGKSNVVAVKKKSLEEL